MDKPLPLIIAETKQAIVEILNTSKLPPCILAPIAREIYDAVLQAQQTELAQAKAQEQEQKEDKK